MTDAIAPAAPTTLPRVHSIAVRDMFHDDCETCPARAGHMCEPECFGMLDAEFITFEDGYADAPVCVTETDDCANRPDLDGFYPVRADGQLDEDCSPEWAADGQLIACGSCGRVYSQLLVIDHGDHAQVLFTLDTPPAS